MPTLTNVTGRVIDDARACIDELEEISIAYEQEFPPRDGVFLSAGDLRVHPHVASFLQCQPHLARGLYRHQHKGVTQVLAGRHTVVSTATSSGKSLIFGIPVMNVIAESATGCALLIYPQKALANDQLQKFQQMAQGVLGSTYEPGIISRYDGSTPSERRADIRKHARIVLTNPDMLHLGILQFHDKWARFFANLRYVVVDESHDYRGMFGTSVAYILRRLRAVAQRYGSNPTFVSASATILEPTAHMKRLTGLEFQEIAPSADGSVQGRKNVWLLRSTQHFYRVGRDLTIALVNKGLTCLTFCPSRVSAERLLDDLPESVRRDDRFRVYRAGLRSSEREEIERGLASGTVKGVFSTSALELGIDIGSLDAVVCVGLPNTMMSLWQRAGRVGRSGKDGAIFFVPADTPLDTYYAENPTELFSRSNEPLAVNLQNRRLVCHHLACAIDEAGDEKLLNLETLGPDARHAMELRQAGRLNHEIFYSTEKHIQTPVRSSDAQNYQLKLGDEPIGEIDQWHLLRETYPHAIYLHGGRRYRVQDIFRSKREVRLVPERSANRTVPLIRKSVRTRRVRSVTEYPGLAITEANLEVTERLIAIQEKKPDGQTINQFEGSQGLPPHRLPTEGVCVEVKRDLLVETDRLVRGATPMSVYRAIERLLGALFPVIMGPCDTMDYDTFSDRREGAVQIYLYDQVHDGIDLAVRAYGRVGQLLEKAHQRVEACECGSDTGCFRCVRNPDEEEITDRQSCLRVLDRLLHQIRTHCPTSRTFNVDLLEEQTESLGECPACKGKVKADDRFCAACGERLQKS